jgi:hypothetical protein
MEMEMEMEMETETGTGTGAGTEIRDYNYLRYPGWEENNACLQKYFSQETVNLISYHITKLTQGVDPKNRSIIVPDCIIYNVMDGIFRGYRPPVGDIYSRYIIPNNEQESMIQSMIDQTIEVITANIRNSLGMEQCNQKLSKWVEVMGDFNTAGLRQHAPIKVLGKRPAPMQFNMNY